MEKTDDLPRNQDSVSAWQTLLAETNASEVIRWAAETFGSRLCFASSLGAEDQVITHFIAEAAPGIRLFTLDTGRLFPETYQLIDNTEVRYNRRVEVFAPNTQEVESMVGEHGINLFYKSVENRKLCCSIRKIHPLKRALAGVDAWICGLRRDQAVTRQQVQVIEWDEQFGIVKINPLWNWSEQQVWDCIKNNLIPYNPLHDKGFLSIGCSCCTRAVAAGEDVRAGRWWWEQPEHKECGLHRKDGKLVRAE
ncbi:MAG: phosphoadenylyl-sulfate reductase [Acidobacteria bacterium]|nr:phosphoadenylyl-sulfate reductase [Acidobacteriota bacterium]MCI0621750.1 phosphoadenylyl-sulfate reductase [Acidobacteriota bacterium]MCI0718362.1 phosphoadenylyl-sulfate reductase [Acidobacteriota bacterium]